MDPQRYGQTSMSDPKDTLYRQITLLQLIPRYPGRIATPTLIEKLKERGFKVTPRALQRDLKDRLSYYFPIICHDQQKPYRWSFDQQASFNLPSLDTPAALALHLAEQQLRGLLPPTVVDQLKPQFDAANQHLEHLNQNSLSRWARRVKALPNGKTLIAAVMDENTWRCVAEALLENCCLKVSYLSRQKKQLKDFILHPAGLVTQPASSYLVARVDGYDDLRQFALHRIKKAEVSSQICEIDESFNVEDYIEQGAFARQQGKKPVQLLADIHPQVAWLLEETPLSKDQTLEPLNDESGWYRLKARIPRDQETLWWIYGLNRSIRLYEPEEWVAELQISAKKLNEWYGHGCCYQVSHHQA